MLLSRRCSLFYLMKYVPYIHYFSDEENWGNNNPISLIFQWQAHWKWRKRGLYLPLAPVFSHLLKGLSNLGFWNNQYSPSSASVFSFYFTISNGTQTCPSISHLTKKKSSWPLNISWFFSSFWNSWRNNFELLFLPLYFPSFFRYLFRLWPYSKYTTVIMLTKPIVISLSSCFLSQQQLA